MTTAWRLIDAWRSAFGEYSGEAFIVAVIVVGALIWRLLLLLQQSGSLNSVWWWLWENRPVQCFSCRRIVRRKHARPAIHTVAGQVLLCAECDRRVHSWSGE